MTIPQLKSTPAELIPTTSGSPARLFDLSLATDFSFKNNFPPARARPDLHFTCRMEPPLSINWESIKPLFASREQTEEGVHLFSFFATDHCIMLRFSIMADFYLWSDLIICHLREPAYEFMVEICFLGTVMACWFELQGVLALHAAASVVNGQAVAFLSSNKGGKSSLAAAFMQQGYPLLTDDLLMVEQQDGRPVGRSGYPQMRMWPEQAEMLFGSAEGFSYVHPHLDKRRIPLDFETPGSFQSGRFPLKKCYIPERYSAEEGQNEITITAVSPVEAVLTLAGHSFLAWLADSIGLQAGRLKALSSIVKTVPVSRLSYPSGVEHLPAVCQAVLADL